MIKGLHHNAYRCRDSEETRRFYEDFLGLPLAGTLLIDETKTGRATRALHTRARDGSGPQRRARRARALAGGQSRRNGALTLKASR